MEKKLAAGLGCVVVALLLGFKTCGKAGDDSPGNASLESKSKRTHPSRPPSTPPVERTSSSKYESRWTDKSTGVEQRVRKILEMRADPIVDSVAGEALGTVYVRTGEFGEIWRPATKAWEKMTSEEFKEWRGGAHDRHKVVAILSKSLDPQTRRPVVMRRESIGDGTAQNDAKPTADYDETQSGINIKLTWVGDKLMVKWMASEVEQQTAEVAIPFDPHYLD
jgi:hypothetical protein